MGNPSPVEAKQQSPGVGGVVSAVAPVPSADKLTGGAITNAAAAETRRDIIRRVSPLQSPTTTNQPAEEGRRILEIELDKAITRLAKERVNEAFNQENLEKQISGAMRELIHVANGELTQSELESLVERYLKARNAERAAAMLNEVALEGKRAAKLGVAPDERDIVKRLSQIRESYAEVSDVSDELILKSFASSHDAEYQRKLSRCGWVDRKYYGVASAVSGACSWVGSSLESIGAVLKGAGKLYQDYKQLEARLLARAGDYVKAVWKDPAKLKEDLSAVASKVGAGAAIIGEKCKDLALSAGQAVLSGAKKCVEYLADKGSKLVGAVLSGDLSEAWSTIKDVYSDYQVLKAKVAAGLWTGAKALWSVGCTVVGFLWRDLGLQDLVSGLYHSTIAPLQLGRDLLYAACGRGTYQDAFANFKNNIAVGVSGYCGFAKAAWNQTGIPDLCLAVSYTGSALAEYGRGNKLNAALNLVQGVQHGACAALSLSTIMFIFHTGGASIVAAVGARSSIKGAAGAVMKTLVSSLQKEFLGKASSVIGKQTIEALENAALKQLKEGASKELLEGLAKEASERGVSESSVALTRVMTKHAQDIAEEGGQKLSEAIAKDGAPKALALGNVERTLCTVSERQSSELLRRMGLREYISSTAHEMLDAVKNGKPKDAIKLVTDKYGISPKAAKQTVAQMRQLLDNPKWDKGTIDILQDGISKELHPYMSAQMEGPFRERFKWLLMGEPGKELVEDAGRPWLKTLREGVQSEAKRLGKNLDSYVDELVESGWKGTKKGLKDAIETVVREGLEDAFKLFRAPKVRPKVAGDLGSGADSAAAQLSVMGARKGLHDENNFGLDLRAKKPEEEQQTTRRAVDVVYREIELADGTKLNVVEYYLNGKLVDSLEDFTIADSRKKGAKGGKGAVTDADEGLAAANKAKKPTTDGVSAGRDTRATPAHKSVA